MGKCSQNNGMMKHKSRIINVLLRDEVCIQQNQRESPDKKKNPTFSFFKKNHICTTLR